MKKLIIVGAGGFGREVSAWAQQHPDYGVDWTVAGFLDENLRALNGYEGCPPIIGTVSGHIPSNDELFVCALGSPEIKQRVVEELEAKGAFFISLVHPSVVFGHSVNIERGVVVCPGVVITSDIRVGSFTAINCLSSVGHDVQIGQYVTISGHCDLMGNTEYGDGSFLGSGARIVPGKKVGAGSYVGAGSVVLRSVRPGTRVFGNPAKVFG